MTYILYGSRRSGSLIVELSLVEAGLSYEVKDVNLDNEAQRHAAYANVNPQCKVPTLITPAGEVITESVAIILTLDERYPEAGLLPPITSVERAQALSTLLFIATEIYPIVEINDYPERFSPSEDSTNKVREVARTIWKNRWLLVNERISGNPYLLSSGFCVVDIYIAVVSRWAQQDDWRLKNIPKIEKLTEAVAARPAIEPVWAHHQPEVLPKRF